MKLTETLDADILEFERVTDKVISFHVRQLFQRLTEAGDYFEKLGAEDANSGRAKRQWEDFIQWGKRELPYPHGGQDSIVDLMYQCYTDGYNTKTVDTVTSH